MDTFFNVLATLITFLNVKCNDSVWLLILTPANKGYDDYESFGNLLENKDKFLKE